MVKRENETMRSTCLEIQKPFLIKMFSHCIYLKKKVSNSFNSFVEQMLGFFMILMQLAVMTGAAPTAMQLHIRKTYFYSKLTDFSLRLNLLT